MRADLRRRDERLEAARYGAIGELLLDPEEIIHRAAKRDPRLRDVVRSLELAREFPDVTNVGRQAYLEPMLPAQIADYSAVSPAAATDTVLWTPNATTATHSFIPQNTLLAGSEVLFVAGGVVTTPATPGTVVYTPRYGLVVGGVSLGPTVSLTGTASQTNVPWFSHFFGWTRGQGTTATFFCVGSMESNAFTRDGVIGGIVATIDTTVSGGGGFVISANNSVASWSYTPRGITTLIGG